MLQFQYDFGGKKFGHEQNVGYDKQTFVNFTPADGTFIPTNEWVDIKFVINAEKHTYDLYMNNVKVNETALNLFNNFPGKVITGITGIQVGPNRWDGTSAHLYLDDLTISAYNPTGVLEMDADALTIANSADSDFDLPLVGLYGSEISWTSDNSDVIAIKDGKAIVTVPVVDTKVTLTATITNGDKSVTKSFVVSVAGDSDRIEGISKKLTPYVFSGQKYVMESFVPNVPGLADTDSLEISSSDASVVFDSASNKVIVSDVDEDKYVDVTVKVTSVAGNTVTKTLKLYVAANAYVSLYEGFDYPSLSGKTIAGADAWSVWADDTNLDTTGVANVVAVNPDDATDYVLDQNIIRKRDTSKYGHQYVSWSGEAEVAGDAIVCANVKFSNTAGNQVVWYVTGNVKTSSGVTAKEIMSLYIERGSNVLKCEYNGGSAQIAAMTLPTDQWFNLKFVVHTTDNNYDIYIDNVKVNTDAVPFKNVTESGAVTAITNIVTGPSRWSIVAGHIYIDDIMIRSKASDILATEAKMLDIPDTFIYDYTMPTVGIYEGTTISWASNNESVLSKDGKVNREFGLGNTIVKLTATIVSGDASVEKEFDVKVVKTPYYTIDSLVFENDGATSYNAVPGGKLSKMAVTKYYEGADDNAKAYILVYNALGEMIAMSDPVSVTQSGDITLNMDIPEVEGVYVKALIWNSANFKPLAFSYSTKVADDAVIYSMGDSTMQSYGTVEARKSDNQMTGWMQVLPLAVENDSITIENKAVAGTSTLSFTDKGYIYPIYDSIKPGDYLVIQFGHNDEKPWISEDALINYSPLEGDHNNHPNANPVPDWAVGRTTYEQWLREYAAAARMKGAQVVFATSIYRRAFSGETPINSHCGYPEAMIETAKELNVPLLDLHARTGEWLQTNGVDGSLKYFLAFHGGTDNTHLTYDGAVEVANMAIDEMKRIGLPIAQYFDSVPAR